MKSRPDYLTASAFAFACGVGQWLIGPIHTVMFFVLSGSYFVGVIIEKWDKD